MHVFRNSCSSFFSPLGEVDEEARLAIPVPGACGAVFKRSWEYVGPLGIIMAFLYGVFTWRFYALGSGGALGGVLGGSWAVLWRS